MTRLKKSLAVLLAFAMIFSTMSIAASAWKEDQYNDNDIRFTVHFFRKDANGNWVDAKGRVAPGDEVQARVYAETTYLAASFTASLYFDKNFFDQNIGTVSNGEVKDTSPTTNKDNSEYADILFAGTSAWLEDNTKTGNNKDNKFLNYLISKGLTDEDYFKLDSETGKYIQHPVIDRDYYLNTDYIYTQWRIRNHTMLKELNHNADGSIAESSKADWLYAVEFKVKESGRPVVVDTEGKGGFAKIPAYYEKSSDPKIKSYDDYGALKSITMPVYIDKGNENSNQTSVVVMANWEYDAEFDTKAGYVSTTSFINFDPNGGYFADGSSDTKTVAGIIKSGLPGVEVPQKDDAVFGGWELVEGVDDSMTFDYADKTFKAIWNEPDPEATTYTTRYWEMDENGNYEVKSTTEDETIEGETITAEYDAPAEGFYVDTEKSVLSKTADKNSSNNVLDVYYARNKYTVKYVYTDNGGANTQVEYPVYHGASLPAFADLEDGEMPETEGTDFIGWSDSEDGDVLDKLPETVEGDITLYAQYENEVYTYTFHAGTEEDPTNGEFSNGEKVITLQFEYGTDPEDVLADIEEFVGKPEKAGYEFIGWDGLETNPTKDLSIYAEYNSVEYEVRFFDKDGNLIPNYNDEDLFFFYGEEVEADKHIPEGYRAENSWTVNDTTVVAEFPYEVTEDVDFYAVDSANVYDAVFKINGEVYKTVPTVYLEQIVVPEYEVPAGYDFSGWGYDIGEFGDVMDDVNGKEYNATLTPKEITITFVIEGQEDTVITGKFGEAVEGIPTIPAKEGYEAGSWNPTAPATFPAEDTTYTAVWSASTNTITFVDYDENGAEIVLGTKTAETGAAIEAQADPEKEGHTFNGWLCEDGTLIEEAPTVMPTTSQKYVADWTVNQYSYSFDANGGTFGYGTSTSGTLDYGTEVAIPSVSKEGFDFAGWANADVADPTAADVVIGADEDTFVIGDENVAYKAVWTKKLNTVTYDAGEGTITKADGTTASKVEFSVGYGDSVPTVNDPEREGYEFKGWTEKTEGIAVPDSMPNKALYFVANWEKKPDPITDVAFKIYSVTQIPGTESYSAPVLVKEGAALPGTVIEVVEGTAGDNQYKFSDLVPQASQVLDTSKATSMTLTKEGPNELVIYSNLAEFTVTFDAGEGSWDNETTQTDSGKFGYEIETPADPEREGYEFAGWEGYTEGDTFAEDKTYEAIWNIESFEISFDALGGSEVDPVTFEYGAEIKDLPESTKEGFIFMGWVDAEGNELPATMPAEDIVAYAKWDAVPVYDLTIDAGEGEFDDGEAEHSFEVPEGASLKDYLDEEPTREGYDFAGWVDENGNEIDEETATMPAEGMTVTAKWEKAKYTVTYYLASGEAVEAYDTKKFEAGETIVHPADPELEGFTFVGWFDKDGNDLPAVMGEENIDAYAKFDINTYKVTYIVDGEVYAEYDVVYQAEVPVPSDPASADPALVFAGWKPAVEAVMPAYDLVYTAKFASLEADKYAAKFVVDGNTVDLQILEEGEAIVMPENPEKFGYKFVGWEPEVPAVMPAQDMEFVAQWEVDETLVIIAVGGTVVAGGIIAGSIIGGNAAWITGVSIVGGILVVAGTAALIKHTHTVTYIVDGEVYKTYLVVEGTKVPVPADPAKDGFEFAGWDPEVPEKMGATDLEFVATWGDVAGDNDSADVDVVIPDTGSVAGGLAAFAVISGAAAVAYVLTRKKED